MSASTRGQMLREKLHATLQRHADELAGDLVVWFSSQPFRQVSDSGTRGTHLVQAFLDAVEDGLPERFGTHVLRLNMWQGGSGDAMRNLWLALTLLEDKIWRLVAREMAPEHQVEVLSWVTNTVGAAKDRLACALMAQLSGSRRQAGALEESLTLLSHGTDPAPEDEEQGGQAAAAAG